MENLCAVRPEACFERVVHHHDNRVRNRIQSMLCRFGLPDHPELVDEIVQEVYYRVLSRGRGRLGRRTETQLIAYLGLAAERAVIDYIRSTNAEKRRGARVFRVGQSICHRMDEIPDPRGTPEDALLWDEQQSLFLGYCAALPARRQGHPKAWVMRLAVLEGWSSREISHAAGGKISPSGVDCLVHRVRQRLARDGFGALACRFGGPSLPTSGRGEKRS